MVRRLEHIILMARGVKAGFEDLYGIVKRLRLQDFMREGGELEIEIVRDGAGFEARWFGEGGPDVLKVFLQGFCEVGEGGCADVVAEHE